MVCVHNLLYKFDRLIGNQVSFFVSVSRAQMVPFSDKSTFFIIGCMIGCKMNILQVLLLKYKPLFCISAWSLFDLCQKHFQLLRAHWCALERDHPGTSLSVGKFHLEWAVQKRSIIDENYRVIRMSEKGQDSFVISQRGSLWLCVVKLNGMTVVICTHVQFGNLAQHYSKRAVVLCGIRISPPHCPCLCQMPNHKLIK